MSTEEEESYILSLATIIYGLLAMCIVAPPTEVASVGLTVQNIFSNYLGSEDMNFIYYHMRRAVVTLLCHSFLPLGHYVTLAYLIPSWNLWLPWHIPIWWKLYLFICIALPTTISMLTYHWSLNQWDGHPLATKLGHSTNDGDSWRSVASAINVEFRRINKFTAGPMARRVIVTDSWIMRTSTYTVHLAHQSNVHLTLNKADEHMLSHETSGSVQFLNITVDSCIPYSKPFSIRLNSIEYGNLKDKLQGPIRNVRNIVIQKSLSDRFLQAFTDIVNENNTYKPPVSMELEACIGCMAVTANVKLQKQCAESNDGECRECFCRPLWCIDCMGKWFCSRQNQQAPETWLSSRSPCPMCRSTFCVLDVCNVQR